MSTSVLKSRKKGHDFPLGSIVSISFVNTNSGYLYELRHDLDDSFVYNDKFSDSIVRNGAHDRDVYLITDIFVEEA